MAFLQSLFLLIQSFTMYKKYPLYHFQLLSVIPLWNKKISTTAL